MNEILLLHFKNISPTLKYPFSSGHPATARTRAKHSNNRVVVVVTVPLVSASRACPTQSTCVTLFGGSGGQQKNRKVPKKRAQKPTESNLSIFQFTFKLELNFTLTREGAHACEKCHLSSRGPSPLQQRCKVSE